MKKTEKPKNTLEQLRGVFFQVGLIISCGITLVAFEWTTPVYIADLPNPVIELEGDFELAPITYSSVPDKPEVKMEQKKIDPTQIKIVVDPVEPTDPTDPVVDPNPQFNPDEWKEVEKKEEDVPVLGAGVMPKFQEGDAAIFKFLAENLKYPKMAIENQIQGTVLLRFIVGKNGKVRDIEILRSVNKMLDEEAVRVVQQMPDWTPGRQHGKPVSVYYTLPIKFTLR